MCSTIISCNHSEIQQEVRKRLSMARIWWQLPRCILKNMQKGWNQGSVFTRKWRCVGHKAFPELEKGSSKHERTYQQLIPLETSWSRADSKETVVHQLQRFGDSERSKNRKAIKALLGCTHYLCKQHIPHTTNFSKLIDLIVSCGRKDLEEFVRKTAKNASYTSTDAVTDFVEAIGVWVDELQVNRVRNAPFFSLMADECVDVSYLFTVDG